MKIVHVITGLENGGAEAVLSRLCINDTAAQHVIISMMGPGKYGPILRKSGVEVYYLNMPPGRLTLSGLVGLYKKLRAEKPCAVQTWMYHADLIGGFIAWLAGCKNILWNIRHSDLESHKSKRSTIVVAKACARLSASLPKKIICCAEKAAKIHVALGYCSTKITVIHNGYDLQEFKPSNQLRQRVRNEVGLENSELVLGMVGRFNPQKDHEGLFCALAKLKKMKLGFKCLLVGRAMSNNNPELRAWINHYRLNDEVILLGERSDIPAIMNAIDIHVLSSSFGEAFPNVLAEAMASGTPCVTTDVGDAAEIVGDAGWVVPVKAPVELSAAIAEAANECCFMPEAWSLRKGAAVERVAKNFSLEKMIGAYHNAWSAHELT